MRQLRVLVTGFGPFPGVRVNPSAELARRIARTSPLRHGAGSIRAEVLETRYADVAKRLPAMVEAADVVLMIGVAARERALRVEERGVAHTSRTAPDAGGRAGGMVRSKGARIRRTAAPVAACVAALKRGGLTARRSIDAGRYLCNAGYFEALSRARRGTIVLFVHVPSPAPPPGTLPRSPFRTRKPRLAAMERGLTQILAQLVQVARIRGISC